MRQQKQSQHGAKRRRNSRHERLAKRNISIYLNYMCSILYDRVCFSCSYSNSAGLTIDVRCTLASSKQLRSFGTRFKLCKQPYYQITKILLSRDKVICFTRSFSIVQRRLIWKLLEKKIQRAVYSGL